MEKLAVVLEVKARPGRRDAIRAAWDRHLRPQLQAADSAQELYLVCEDATHEDKLLLVELYSDPSAMIDRHYGHLAPDSHMHAVSLLDALALERAVDAGWTSNRSRADALGNGDSQPHRRRSHRRVDARWTPKLVLVALPTTKGADQQELPEAL